MKKIYFISLILLYVSICQSQIVNIPDANFKEKLLYAGWIAQNANGNNIIVDINHDGEIQVSEALAVHRLSLHNFGIQSLEGISAFTNLTEIMCDNNWISSLDVSMLSNLTVLSCKSNNISNLNVDGLLQLQTLEVDNNDLSYLNLSNLPSLQIFKCNFNNFTSVNFADLTALQKLEFSGNQLVALDISNHPNLTEVTCNNNLLSSINTENLPLLKMLSLASNQFTAIDLTNLPAIEIFDCSNNSAMSQLHVDGNVTLESLTIGGCNLASVDLTSLVNLQTLSCPGNDLTNLDLGTLSNLVTLDCAGNQLTTIDFGSITNIQYLNCNYNFIQNLDLSNLDSMMTLQCRNNLLQTLDVSGMTLLDSLTCSYNFLQTLDCNNNTELQWLFCNGNQLVYLFAKNGREQYGFDFSGNQTLRYICVDEFKIPHVFQQFYNYQYTEFYDYAELCEVNSYCSFVAGGNFMFAEGNAKIDLDTNGCSIEDPSLPYVNLLVSDGTSTLQFISDDTGSFHLPVPPGSYSVTLQLESPDYFTVTPNSFTVDSATQSSPVSQTFCIVPNGPFHDIEILIFPIGVARPGFDCEYKIFLKNKGTFTESGAVTLTFEDAKFDLIASDPMPESSGLNVLSWNYSNLAPFEIREIFLTLNLNSPTETPAVNDGDHVNFTVSAFLPSDEYVADNISDFKQIVVNSFDPNDKTCLQGTTVGSEMIGEFVHYVIRFENTGTFAAQNIVVKDMIDLSKFDIATLIPIDGSHQFETRINGNKVEFIFENIMLPFDDASNDGYVAFKIKTLPTLAIGDTFANSASIYFDYNFPIVTEPAVTTIQNLSTTDFVFEKYFTLYPNPSSEVLNIKKSANTVMKAIEVYNILGQIVLAIPNAETVSSIEVSQLRAGTYFLKINSDKGTTNAKFVRK